MVVPMPFDWLRFFDAYRIPYSEHGPNTSKDNVVVRCPFCGTQDPSQHMSVSLSGRGWKCWRQPTHRGKNPARLVAALAHVDRATADRIVGNAVYIPSDFMRRMKEALVVDKMPAAKKSIGLELPREFKPFTGLPSSKPFVRYLVQDRGFSQKQVATFTQRYGLRYCARGTYRGRVIFPVYYRGRLVSWTGRTIYADEVLRYRALSSDGEKAEKEGYKPAIGSISHYLLWYDELMATDADTLVLCEGPFDALKISVLGRSRGVVATCFFTAAPTNQQLLLLGDLLPRFKRRVMILDQAGTFATGVKITNALSDAFSTLDIITYRLPPTLKDPGLFGQNSFEKFLIAINL